MFSINLNRVECKPGEGSDDGNSTTSINLNRVECKYERACNR